MTVFNEGDFLDYAIRSCIDHVDDLVIVEGSYLETQKLGIPPRSTDETLSILEKHKSNPKIHIIFANELSDPQQRQIGFNKIKELNPNGWMLLIDGDEIYDAATIKMVKNVANSMDKNNQYAAYFKSLTFVNDFDHYTEQDFPRLFKITQEASFFNDNYVSWKNINWQYPYVVKLLNIKYFHFSFAKNIKRFSVKRDWWNNRFEKSRNFEYDWIEKDGKIESTTHKVVQFTGKLPSILKDHPLWRKDA
jgi:hypothetical protein